jgi:spore maturation protein CgeB
VKIVILGLSITSSWGNGHATTYRSLVRGLVARGHDVLFLERDAPWYAGNRDQPNPPGLRTALYESLEQLFGAHGSDVREADLVMVGSFVPEGVTVGEWVLSTARGITAFYDIDTPVTVEKLAVGDVEYITPDLIARYGLYLSFTGGPLLRRIESEFGARMARALYCSVDPQQYKPTWAFPVLDLGYLGTWSEDRQPGLEALMLDAARRWPQGRFAIAGPLYPDTIVWPANVRRTIHLSPAEHARFYGSQRFTLNITRDAMKRAGFSPSVRLFEAAACGVPIISDWWPGLDTILEPGRELLLSTNCDDTLRYLQDMSDTERLTIGQAARRRVLAAHTPEVRARQLEEYFVESGGERSAALPQAVSA